MVPGQVAYPKNNWTYIYLAPNILQSCNRCSCLKCTVIITLCELQGGQPQRMQVVFVSPIFAPCSKAACSFKVAWAMNNIMKGPILNWKSIKIPAQKSTKIPAITNQTGAWLLALHFTHRWPMDNDHTKRHPVDQHTPHRNAFGNTSQWQQQLIVFHCCEGRQQHDDHPQCSQEIRVAHLHGMQSSPDLTRRLLKERLQARNSNSEVQ